MIRSQILYQLVSIVFSISYKLVDMANDDFFMYVHNIVCRIVCIL